MRVLASRADAAAWAADHRAAGRVVVFTSGVFDVLHPGHTRYLAGARAHGDVIIVAVNADRSVRALKGADRPLHPAQERAELLSALACVDAVVVFDDDTPLEIVRAVQPDVLAKAGDQVDGAIVGRDVVEGRGGRVVQISRTPGYSTTSVLQRARQA